MAVAVAAPIIEAEAPEIETFVQEEGTQLAEGASVLAEQAQPALERAGAGIEQAASAAETEFQELAGQFEEYTGNLIYRNGGHTPGNYTPDLIKDVQNAPEGHLPGLSTFDSIENMMKANPQLQPGTNVQMLDPSRLQGTGLRAVFDNSPLGHVTITAPSYEETVEWASTRADVLIHQTIELAHEFTQAVYNARIDKVKIPK